MIDIASQIACVRREIGLRTRVYPRWVEAGKMKQERADYEVAAMKAVLQTLEGLAPRQAELIADDTH